MIQHPVITTGERVELPIAGAKGELLVIAHVDDEGYPVVTIVATTKRTGDAIIAEDISYDGRPRSSHIITGQAQITITPA